MQKPKGAPARILDILEHHADEQRNTTMSLRDLSIRSGYCMPTVSKAIRQLELLRYISKKTHGRLPATYHLLPDSLRNSIVAGELVGLLERYV